MQTWTDSSRPSWNSYKDQIERVIVGNSITSIGSYAFKGYTKIVSVSLGSSVTSIDSFAFSTCESLTVTNIPESVETISNHAFQTLSLSSSVPHIHV